MQFDILMPLILFALPLLAIFLAKRAEGKLKATINETEFGNKDTALFTAMIITAISVILFIPDQTVLVIFLFSYCSLLFTFSYAFSDMRPTKMRLYCGTFAVAGVLAAIAAFSGILSAELQTYGVVAFVALTVCSVAALLYSQWKTAGKKNGYIAALAPAMFVLLFLFFNQTSLWFPTYLTCLFSFCPAHYSLLGAYV
jgi:hypothetical protein